VAAAGFALLARPGLHASYWSGFLPGIAVLGLGMAIAIAPLTTTVMNAAGADAAGTASGVNNALSRVAGVLAIAVFGTLMAAAFEPRLRAALDTLTPDLAEAVWRQRGRLGAIEVPGDSTGALHARAAVQEAFVAGYRWIMATSALLALASAAVGAMWIRDVR
jgi:preprotein translocase subunit SecG